MTESRQYVSTKDLRRDWEVRFARSYELDRLGAESTRQLLAFERPPKWASDFALLRRMDRLARLREG